jgi:hypothetical protein
MMQLVRAAMSLACFAAAGGIVLSQTSKDTSQTPVKTFVQDQQRLDELLEELTPGTAATHEGPIVVTNETLERMAQERAAANFAGQFPTIVTVEGPAKPPRRAAVRRATPAASQPVRSAYPTAGSKGRPRTIWDRSRWREDIKIKERTRDRLRKYKGERTRIAEYRRSTKTRLYGTSNPKSHYERSRRYRAYGSVWTGIGRIMNPALNRGRHR